MKNLVEPNKSSTFALAIKQHAYGTLADRLGNGLQNRVERFDSARHLEKVKTMWHKFMTHLFFCSSLAKSLLA